MRLGPLAQGEQVRAPGGEVAGEGFGPLQVGRERGRVQRRVLEGEGAQEGGGFEQSVQRLRSVWGFFHWLGFVMGGINGGGEEGRTVCRGGGLGASGRRGWVAGGLEEGCARRVVEEAGGGVVDRWLWVRRMMGCMKASEGWIEGVLAGVEGRTRCWCRRRVWSGLRMPCL